MTMVPARIHQLEKGYGGLGALLFGIFAAAVMYFFIFPTTFHPIAPSTPLKGTFKDAVIGCIPEELNSPNPTFVTTDGYTYEPDDSKRENKKDLSNVTYRRVKKSVPIDRNSILNSSHWDAGAVVTVQDRKYQVYLPNEWAEACTEDLQKRGICNPETSPKGNIAYFETAPQTPLRFFEYGMILLVHLDDNGNLLIEDGWNNSFDDPQPFVIADVYIDPSRKPLPDNIINCKDLGSNLGIVLKSLLSPTPTPTFTPTPTPIGGIVHKKSKDEKQLQIDWFVPEVDVRSGEGWRTVWWTPHCKPAVYLYPEKETAVNVQVTIPHGKLLYTDPVYPLTGWHVIAYPNGKLYYLGTNSADSNGNINYPSGIFPYLYYEARLEDDYLQKPTSGFVKPYTQLSAFLTTLLPQLGLNETETNHFLDYWSDKLPSSPYYFIGIVPQSHIEQLEPLTINPPQDTTIRVALYFEKLEQFKLIPKPEINTPKRDGFTVVEWGGMVKTDPNHPFTCSQ